MQAQDKPKEGKDLMGVTRDVTKFDKKVNGVQFNIWDSPGVQDLTETDDAIIQKIKTKLTQECTDIHLLLYCLRMNTDRIESNDELAIKRLTECFTPRIWEISVFALTFANKVDPPKEMDTDRLAPIYFKRRLEQYKHQIITILKKCKMDERKASEIAVIPTGYHTTSRSHPGDPYKLCQLDGREWYNPFWNICGKRMEATALISLFYAHKDNMDLEPPAENNSHQQPARNEVDPKVII